MVRRRGRWTVPAMVLAAAAVLCFAGCRQTAKFADGVRARRAERAVEAEPPVFDSVAAQVEMAAPARREHPAGSAIAKTVEPTPPTRDEGGVGQSADNPYRNGSAEEWEKMRRHKGDLVKWRSLDVRGRTVEMKGVPAPPVKSILFHWGDGTHTKRMPSASHTYAGEGFYRIDIVIEDVLSRHFHDGTTIRIEPASGGATPQGGSGSASQSTGTQQGASGP